MLSARRHASCLRCFTGRIKFMGLCLFAAILIYLIAGNHAHPAPRPALGTDNAQPSADTRYIVLIDAGSSGSRIHVHSYTLVPSGLPRIEPSQSQKLKPGALQALPA